MNTASHVLRPAIFAFSVLLSCALQAEVYFVTSPADSGPDTLRQAIIDAGQNTSDDVIIIDAAIFLAGTFGIPYLITLTSGELTPVANSGTLTIDASEFSQQDTGGSVTPVSIRASGGRILSNPAGSTLTLINIGLRDGDGTGAAQTGTGGAILNLGTLTLTNCTLSRNSTTGSNSGGAISNQGILTATGCSFHDNTASGNGGGIANATNGIATLTNCTIANNRQTASSVQGGGGINHSATATSLSLIHCTVSGNSATGSDGGGGLRVKGNSVTLRNSIIHGNTSPSATSAADLLHDGGITKSGNNIIGANAGSIAMHGSAHSSTAPNLDTLGDHGGPVPTMPPLTGSAAIEGVTAGNEAAGVTTDARGNGRALDGDLNGADAPDIGAVEFVPVNFLVVNNTSDSGAGSLRQAIHNAALLPGPDTLLLDPSLSGQTISLSADPGDSSSGIQVNDSGGVTVDASALPGGLTIDDGTSTSYRLFAVTPGSSLTVIGLTLANGGGSSFSSIGGAIYNGSGTLTLTQCTLSGNSTGSIGGAIYNNFGTLTLTQCTLSGNTATSSGGAIYNQQGALTLTQCTLSGNSANDKGGAVGSITSAASPDYPSSATLTNCTFATNSANNDGGAIYNTFDSLTLTNCIVAGNTSIAGSGDDISGPITANGNNLIGGDPLLAPLGDYGGPTQTMPPLPGSLAIDGVAPANVVPGLTTDQRGVPFRDGNANGIVSPDIGAAEADVIVVTTAADENDTPATLGGGVSLREAVRDVTPGGVIMFDPALFNGSTPAANTITLTLGPLNPQVDCTLDASTCPAPISVVHQPTIYQQPQSLVVGPGNLAVFSITVANVNNGLTRQWRSDGVTVSGETGNAYAVNTSPGATRVIDVVLGEATAPGILTLNDISIAPFSAISQPATLTSGSVPVTILSQPVSAMLPVGGSTTLSVIAVGPPPPQPVLKYQWYKAGKAIAGATKSSYTITNAQLASAGAYSCVVSSGFTKVASSTAEIGVVDTRPKTVNLAPGKKFVPTVLAAGNGLSFVWKRDATTLASTAKSFPINAVATTDEGLYTCAVTGPGGTLGNGFNTQLNVITGVPVLGALAPPNAVITQQYFYQIPEAAPTTNRKATSFSVVGLPPGLKCDPLTGLISGRPTATKPGGYALTIKATNLSGSDTKTATLTVNGMPPPALGSFTGVGARHALNDNLGARFDLSTTSTGMCSGSVTLGARTKQPFVNQLLKSYGNGDAVISASIPGLKMADGTPLYATVDINLATTLAQLTLTHPNGTQLVIPAWHTATTPAAFATKYALALDASAFVLPAQDNNQPQGFGFSTFTVSSTGTLTLAGKLPDGSALTGGTFVGAQGQVLVFQLLYANKGSLVGNYAITPASPVTNNTIAGALDWMKPAPTGTSTDTVYKAGFGPLTLTAEGGAYVAPAAGQRVMGAPVALAPAPNSTLHFELGGLASLFTQDMRITNPSPAGFTNTAVPVAPLNNSTALPVLTASTGAFSGSFTIAGASASLNRKAPFFGQIVTRNSTTQGYGFFLLPTVPVAPQTVATSPKLSGRVEFTAP